MGNLLSNPAFLGQQEPEHESRFFSKLELKEFIQRLNATGNSVDCTKPNWMMSIDQTVDEYGTWAAFLATPHGQVVDRDGAGDAFRYLFAIYTDKQATKQKEKVSEAKN